MLGYFTKYSTPQRGHPQEPAPGMGTGARDKVAVLPDAVLLPHQSRTLPSHQAMTWLLPFPPLFISWSLESRRCQHSLNPGSVPPALCDTGWLPASPACLQQPQIPVGEFQLLQWERERLLCGWEGLALPGSTTEPVENSACSNVEHTNPCLWCLGAGVGSWERDPELLCFMS